MRVMAGLLPQTSVLICILGTFTVTVISQALIGKFVKLLILTFSLLYNKKNQLDTFPH